MTTNRSTSVLAVLAMAAFMFMGAGCSSTPQPAQTGTAATPTDSTATQKTYTANEVAKHGTQSDCWMIIDGKVYDLTSFIGLHPGGPDMIAQYCGKDGSTGYATKDRPNPQPHSTRADTLLPQYLIGNLAN